MGSSGPAPAGFARLRGPLNRDVGRHLPSPFVKLRRNRGVIRRLGGGFVAVGALLTVMGGYMLLEPGSTLLYNGAETTSPSAKLQFMISGVVALSFGLLVVFAPRRLLDRLSIFQRKLIQLRYRGKPRVA
jgi:hypothetical protein